MELAVHGKQMSVGDALRTHVKDKLEDISGKYFNHATYATVTFSKDGHGHPATRAHITIQMGKNILVTADALEKDPYVAFDTAASKAGKQLRRYKRRLRDHHARQERAPESAFMDAKYYSLASEKEEAANDDKGNAPAIIAEMATRIETMSVSDAVMRLDLSRAPAMMFRNAKHDGLNMIYRRADGNIGWVDPENQKILKATIKTPAAKPVSKPAAKPTLKSVKSVPKKPVIAKKPKAQPKLKKRK
jgi:ribosomal subunit interface protein